MNHSSIIFSVDQSKKLKSHIVKFWLFKTNAEQKETGKYKWRVKTRDRGQGERWKNNHFLPAKLGVKKSANFGLVAESLEESGGRQWCSKIAGYRATQQWWFNWKSMDSKLIPRGVLSVEPILSTCSQLVNLFPA